MERAAALGRGDGHEARREGKTKGGALARRYMEGELEDDGLSAGLAELAPDQQEAARQGAAQALLLALDEGRPRALTGLRLLAGEGPAAEAWQELAQAEEARRAALARVEKLMAAEMSQELAAAGISGSAVHPNPQAHPQYAARTQTALAETEDQKARARAKMRAALGAE